MTSHLSRRELQEARAVRRRLAGGRCARTDEDAVQFIEERGFVLLMPIKGIPLPSLSEAGGDHPWADEFRCTDRAWAWKETLPAQKLCAYGKLIRGRGTFIGWRLYPAFVAAYGPAGDLAEEYEAGRLARADRSLVELVAASGPIDSRDLWRKAKSIFAGERHRFTAALDRLQARFMLTVAGGSLEGWTRHTWDLVERQAPPGLLDKLPAPGEARAAILLQALENCVALPEGRIGSMLGWTRAEIQRALACLLAAGRLAAQTLDGQRWVSIADPWRGDDR
ncbi:MAG: hypothetical protein ACM3ZC_04885 [Bacteroidota bacterium]